MFTESKRREAFPSLEEMTYLNTAAEGIPPIDVQNALDQYFADKQSGMDGREAHAKQYQAVKALAGQLYGLSAGEIGLCSCSSEAYNLAALALKLKPGDEVIVNDLDFPAGSTPWLAPGSPADVKVWRSRDGALDVADLVPLLSANTRVVTVSLVSFYNGFMIDLQEVGEAVHRHSNALLTVDVTQALGRIPLDLSGADLVVSSTHKWILASHGGGLVGVPSARADDWTVPAGGWFNLENPFGPERFEKITPKHGAASFSVGMPNYPAIYAIRAGLEYILQEGVETIQEVTQPLVEQCLAGLQDLPVTLITPPDLDHVAGILAFRHGDMDAIHRRLHAKDIHVMAQAGRMRIAIHGYNTAEDIENLLRALHGALKHVSTA